MISRLSLFTILLLASVPPALGVGGGAACGRCAIPYPDMYEYADSSGVAMTPGEASSVCYDRLDTLPFGMEIGGYVIRWVGEPPATPEATARFFCFACINSPFAGGNDPGQPSLPMDQASWIALQAYPGRVSAIETFIEDDQIHGRGASYLVTIVDDNEDKEEEEENDQGAAIVRIDPFTYETTVLQEASTANH